MKKLRCKNGKIENFWVKGEKNPCNCGSNLYHEVLTKDKTVVGVCNCCDTAIYEINYTPEEINAIEWKTVGLKNNHISRNIYENVNGVITVDLPLDTWTSTSGKTIYVGTPLLTDIIGSSMNSYEEAVEDFKSKYSDYIKIYMKSVYSK